MYSHVSFSLLLLVLPSFFNLVTSQHSLLLFDFSSSYLWVLKKKKVTLFVVTESPASECVGTPSKVMSSQLRARKGLYLEMKYHTGKGLRPYTPEAPESWRHSPLHQNQQFWCLCLFLPLLISLLFLKMPTLKIILKTYFLPGFLVFL